MTIGGSRTDRSGRDAAVWFIAATTGSGRPPPSGPMAPRPTDHDGVVTTSVMSLRALNRALLERQLLLRRSPLPVDAAIEHLVGMQAQAPNPPYVGLWTRLERFRAETLSQLLLDRRVVRVALMRGTLHLVTAEDCLGFRPMVQPVFDRSLATDSQHSRRLTGLDIKQVGAAGRALVEEQPRTAKQLGALLVERWPGRDPSSLAFAIRSEVPLVQVPPRGLWGAGGRATLTSAESWLGRPLEPNPSLEGFVLRYLAAFGPATVGDAQTWSGLTGLGEIVARQRGRLRTFRDEQGRELFDLPDAPRPDPDVHPPVRYLPEYDNLLLSHADRSRVIADEDRSRLWSKNGILPGTILVDGFVRGAWRITRQRDAATLVVQPFGRLAKKTTAALGAEGARLLRFAAAGHAHDVQFVPLA